MFEYESKNQYYFNLKMASHVVDLRVLYWPRKEYERIPEPVNINTGARWFSGGESGRTC